jgi:hypothetical protein
LEVAVGEAVGDVEHDDRGVGQDVVPVPQASKLLLAGCIIKKEVEVVSHRNKERRAKSEERKKRVPVSQTLRMILPWVV